MNKRYIVFKHDNSKATFYGPVVARDLKSIYDAHQIIREDIQKSGNLEVMDKEAVKAKIQNDYIIEVYLSHKNK